jgi:hypothetical protein
MITKAGFGCDNLALRVDLRAEGTGSIQRLTGLCEKLDTAAVINGKLASHALPKRGAMLAEWTRGTILLMNLHDFCTQEITSNLSSF